MELGILLSCVGCVCSVVIVTRCARPVLLQAKEKEEKKLKAKQKEAARLQVAATT